MARNFDVQKNKEPLYWSIGLFLMAIWCFRDGWYPPESKMEKYPEIPTEFWSFALEYEFYRFNRVTAIIMAVASGVMGTVYVPINRP